MVSSALISSTSLSLRPKPLVPYLRSPHASRLLWNNQPRRCRVFLALSAQPSSTSPLESTVGTGQEITSVDVVGQNDLLIVGPGVLGRMVAEQWQQEHPGCRMYGQTMTADHHDELMKAGINPSLRGSKFTHKLPNIIFCAPPSLTPDYPGDVRLAASNWSGEGCFLFTSSTALYDCSDNGICNEDAALLAVAIMKKKLRSQVFLGCDNHPLSRQDLMDAVNRSGKFSKKFMGFTGSDGPLGKRMYNSKTRAEIGWEPKYPSFRQFLGLTD
ncbi:NAD(P)-binding domain-containing protein [Dioscorea alata]|uniref:NAD(P)-binding domain-containing protein n=1 Tax=Dioscorea alata TaxID=55571 RepID=A0ACB7U3Y7_DIOAL|nr:NAD(P)-binding domain-containing protein [Dioscorea alata]